MAGQDNGAAPPAVGVIGIAATGPPAGYPRTIIGLTGHLAALSLLTAPLTGPGPGAPATRAEAYLRAHGERGLAAADASTATLAGLRQVRWEQTYRGIPVLDGEVRVNLDAAGRVLNVVGARRTPRLASTRPAVGRAEAVRDAGGGRAELIIEGGRLVWSVTEGPEHTVVDATSGALVARTSLRRQDAVPVWEDYPGGRAGSVELTSYVSSTTQLKNRWIYAFSDTDPNDEPDPGEDVAPGAYPFHSIACPPVLCSWTPSTDDWEQNREQNAVQAFYLANRFREYLAGPRIGFDGFKDDDPVLLNTDDGRTRDNSSMWTRPEGTSPIMEMFLFGVDPGFRAVNGGDDANVVFHEYAHGLTDRLVGFTGQDYRMGGVQGDAMAEGFSDFYAKSAIVERGLETDTAAAGEIDMGVYTDKTRHRLRTEPLDCPVGGAPVEPCPHGGYTYGDLGSVVGRPEPHADGEIWAQTLWDLRTALGTDLTTRIVTRALPLSPVHASFLDMRDAILLADADLARQEGRGDDAAAIWAVFARRGMGHDAQSDGGDDPTPSEGFAPPPTPTVTPSPPAPAPGPPPTATVTPSPPAPAPTPPGPRVAQLRASATRSARFTVTCFTACTVTAKLTVDRRTARRLHLRSRTVGTLSRRLHAGTATLTVKLSAKALKALRRSRLKSFRATVAVTAGSAAARRIVTVRR